MTEDERLEDLGSSLFDMFLAFEREFTARAIDDLDVSASPDQTRAQQAAPIAKGDGDSPC